MSQSQGKYEVAVFNGHGVLIAVKEVSVDDYVTDPQRRQMALSQNHDLHGMIRKYKADANYEALEPIYEKLPRVLEMELAGWALARWHTVEEALLEVYTYMLQGAPQEPLRAAFYAISNFRDKLNAINALIQLIRPDYEPEWRTLRKKIDNNYTKRNKIAHMGVQYKNGKYVFYDQSASLLRSSRKKAVTSKEIEECCHEFSRIYRLIRKFAGQLQADTDTPP